MLTKLHKYVIKAFTGPLVITFFITIFLLLMQFLWKYIDDLVGKGLEWHVILELLFYASVTLVPMGLPLAILLSSLMTFGNLGERYELFALKSSGISLYRIMRPLIVLVFFISIAAFYFSNNILPYTNLKMRTLLHDVRQQRPEVSLQEGIFDNTIDDFSIKVEKKDKKDNTLHNVLLYDHRDKRKNASIITANTGEMKTTSDKSYIILKLYDGYMYDAIRTNRNNRAQLPYQTTSFEKQTIYISTKGFGFNRSNESLFKDNFEMLNISQLNNALDSLNYDFKKRKQVVGTNLMKYSMFRGMRYNKKNKDNNKDNNVVYHEKSSTVSKDNKVIKDEKQVIVDKKKDDNKDQDSKEVQKDDKRTKPPKSQKNIKKQTEEKLKNNKEIETDFPFPVLNPKNEENLSFVNYDSLINSLTNIKKNRVVNFAQNHARSAQTYLYYAGNEVESSRRWMTRHEIEIHKKFVLAVSCLVLFFVGAPLGAIIRKGGFGMPVVISVILFIFYFIISMFSEKMVREVILPPEIGMWISTFVLLPVGILLTIKAANDSMNIRPEAYTLFINKIKVAFKKRRKKRKEKKIIRNEKN